MTDSQDNDSGAEPDSLLAIDGGAPAIPDGPPRWPPNDPCIRDQLLAAWDDGSWGSYHGNFSDQLVARLAALLQVPHVLPTCSGTFAVELALRGLKVQPGDEVVLAAYDFPGNFRAIESVGATPVLVDIDPCSCSLDPELLVPAIGPATRAIGVSHLHGGLADMQRITTLARERGIHVVEDACQVPGATVQGRPAGTWGDAGVLSFGGSKLLTAGRGGAMVTSDAQVLQRAKIYGERGNDAFPLSELQAAVLLPQLENLDRQNTQRRISVARLREIWAELDIPVPVRSELQPGSPTYYKVALSYEPHAANGRSRDEFVAAILAEGVLVGAGFRGFVRRGARRCRSTGALIHAAKAAESIVLLHHPALLLPSEKIELIGHAFRKVITRFRRM